jgi:FG-GAP-like repeat
MRIAPVFAFVKIARGFSRNLPQRCVWFAGGSSKLKAVALESGNLHGDGKADVVVGSSAAATFTVFLNKGTGALGTLSDTPPPAETSVFSAKAILAMTAGDIDADGKRDVLAFHKNNFSTTTHTEVAIEGFQNDGTGTGSTVLAARGFPQWMHR